MFLTRLKGLTRIHVQLRIYSGGSQIVIDRDLNNVINNDINKMSLLGRINTQYY